MEQNFCFIDIAENHFDSLVYYPPVLVKAHNELDKAVDLAHRPQPFTSEANRMVFLFELYEKYTAGLFAEKKRKKRKRKAENRKDVRVNLLSPRIFFIFVSNEQ